MYDELLASWEKSFSKDRMLVLFSEDFFSNPSVTAEKVYLFLGLKPYSLSDSPHARDGGFSEDPPREAANLLREFYRPHNEKLRSMLGRKLPWD
jgi:hypothetical protein